MASSDSDADSTMSTPRIDKPGNYSKSLPSPPCKPTTFQEMLDNGFQAKSKSSLVSTMSLPQFRKEHPRLFWPVKSTDAMVEIKPGQNLEDPHRFGIEYLDGVVGSSGSKTMVIKGKVWKEDRQKEVLAIKVILYDVRAAKEKALEELRILQNIDHPHIIAALGSCSTVVNNETRLGILLFPLAPKNLEQHLQNISEHNAENARAPIHPQIPQLLSFYACLCRTVLHLHGQRSPIKHRDIKPSNILIDREGTVILADFDIARQYDDKTKAVTIRGVEYTVKYAPTHVVRQAPAGLEWDVNCLGFVFLEMATIILGKTTEDLLLFLNLHKDQGDKVPKVESVARTTDTTEEARTTEVRFSDALDNGTIDKWINELQNHARKNFRSMPDAFKNSKKQNIVDNFLQAISKMMKAQQKDCDVLESAWGIFSSLVDHCTHCYPVSGARNTSTRSPPLPGLPEEFHDTIVGPVPRKDNPETSTKPGNTSGAATSRLLPYRDAQAKDPLSRSPPISSKARDDATSSSTHNTIAPHALKSHAPNVPLPKHRSTKTNEEPHSSSPSSATSTNQPTRIPQRSNPSNSGSSSKTNNPQSRDEERERSVKNKKERSKDGGY